MPRRIIPVASGKGGVGKTTFAINFALALSRSAPTLLVDLDTGTSSVRNTLQVPIERDLYHFHRRGLGLEECVTRLGAATCSTCSTAWRSPTPRRWRRWPRASVNRFRRAST